ncbi:hypothetical protein [Streptomyces blattellae]|uniref:hypothetical protein n=1 Tax=Streptomyces blattellae TaxID=2569855 RepID=UPI0012B6DF18|nr:hypothetical protein [Streptomyces blattellae]
MKFVQIIDFETERLEEMEQQLQQFVQHNAGKGGGLIHRILLRDRDNPGRYLALLKFDSYDEAMRNSEDPETTKLAEQLGASSIGERTNCDVLDMSELK